MKRMVLPVLFLLFLSACEEESGQFGFMYSVNNGEDVYKIIATEAPYAVYEIEFEAEKSNKEALRSLKALRADIIFPNSRGKSIYLKGIYNNKSNKFTLEHWYIVTPFLVRKFNNSDRSKPRLMLLSKPKLQKSDFYGKVDFEPAKYELRRSAFKREKYGGQYFKPDYFKSDEGVNGKDDSK